MIYITNTFSPLMLSRFCRASVKEITLDKAKEMTKDAVSAISHEVTSQIISTLLERQITFNRVNLSLEESDVVVAIIPNFRAEVAREFTKEEVGGVGYRCFRIEVEIEAKAKDRI